MIYSFRPLNDCAMNTVVYLNGNEHDAYQITGRDRFDVEVTNLRSGKKLLLPGTADCERPKLDVEIKVLDEEANTNALAAHPEISSNYSKEQKEILAQEIEFHRMRSIASRRLGDHMSEEHEAEVPDQLYEFLLAEGYDPADLDCTEVVMTSLPEPNRRANSTQLTGGS